MKILVMKILIGIPYSRSLKEKRSVVKRIKDRVWMKFRASISEVDEQDSQRRAVLGISYVSNDRTLLDSIDNKIINLIEHSFPGMIEDHHYIVEDY